ncbi:hypothetical protein PIB30_053772 [Stylosanthes scabra]|uniref:Secreted protein n=1 Tax=Stylosanthes scabra TaxID=79078 RepID=A0ABU6ULI7_9FABA|nr:hypothetical protein [Stylosanthes scabra]
MAPLVLVLHCFCLCSSSSASSPLQICGSATPYNSTSSARLQLHLFQSFSSTPPRLQVASSIRPVLHFWVKMLNVSAMEDEAMR